MRRVIAGIDPGTTTGIARLSFSGKLLFITSKRGIGVTDVEKIILKHGKPAIIAADVPRPPSTVERIATTFRAVLFTPPTHIPEKEKDEIAKRFGVKVDDHARDALAAAYTAYIHYRPKIEKVRRRLQDEEFVETIIERVIKGEQTVRTLLSSLKEGEKEVRRGTERKRESKEIVELRRKVGELLREKEKLKKELERAKEREELRKAFAKGEYIASLEEEIMRLRAERERLREGLRKIYREVHRLEKEVERNREFLKKVKEALQQGKIIGPPEKVEGEEIAKGVVVGEIRKSPEEKIKEIIEEYRERRRKEMNLL